MQEPRALDSAERLVHKLKSNRDRESATLVQRICGEEVAHVRIGMKWHDAAYLLTKLYCFRFRALCEREGVDPMATFHTKVNTYVGLIPPPFNDAARSEANMPEDWYKNAKPKNA